MPSGVNIPTRNVSRRLVSVVRANRCVVISNNINPTIGVTHVVIHGLRQIFSWKTYAKTPAITTSGRVKRVAESIRNNVPMMNVTTTFNGVDVSKDISMPEVNMMPIKTAATNMPTPHDFNNNQITWSNLGPMTMESFMSNGDAHHVVRL